MHDNLPSTYAYLTVVLALFLALAVLRFFLLFIPLFPKILISCFLAVDSQPAFI